LDRNFLLAIALSFAFMAVWTMYTSEQRAPQETAPATSELVQEAPVSDPDGPDAVTVAPTRPTEEPRDPAPAPRVAEAPRTPEKKVVVSTPLFEAELTTHGGALTRWELMEYDDPSVDGTPRVDIVTAAEGGIALATPFEELGYGDQSRAAYEVSQPDPYTVVFERAHGGADRPFHAGSLARQSIRQLGRAWRK